MLKFVRVKSLLNSALIHIQFILGALVQSRAQTKHGEAAFSCYTANKWNKLPVEIKLSPNVDIFKSMLKTFIFSFVCMKSALYLLTYRDCFLFLFILIILVLSIYILLHIFNVFSAPRCNAFILRKAL